MVKNIAVRLCKSLEDREKLENDLRFLEKFWPKSSKFLSLKEMTRMLSLSLRLTPIHKFLASKIEGTVLENPQLKLAPLGNGQVFALIALDLCVLSILGEVLQQVMSQANLLYLLNRCNVFSLKPTRSMCY